MRTKRKGASVESASSCARTDGKNLLAIMSNTETTRITLASPKSPPSSRSISDRPAAWRAKRNKTTAHHGDGHHSKENQRETDGLLYPRCGDERRESLGDVRITTDSQDRSRCQPYERQQGADQAPEATPHSTEDQGNCQANVKPVHRFLRPRPGVLVDSTVYYT